MFSRAVSHGKTPYSWKITPRSGPGPVTGSPLNNTRPAVGFWKPASMLIIEVLPQPDGERNDYLPENLELAGAECLRDPDVERGDLRYPLIHHDHAGKERGVEQDNQFCDLVDPEIDNHQRDQRDRRQCTKEIDHRI